MIKELRNRARDVLLTQAIASEESSIRTMPADDLLTARGHEPGPGAGAGDAAASRTREDLADQAVDDLMDIEGLDGSSRPLIMKAREPWFERAAAEGWRTMADVTVAQFADALKVPVDRLLVQLEQAGIKVIGAEST
jgi:hypothetical protein